MKKIQDFIWGNSSRPLNYKLDNIPRTQDLEPIYLETSGFYIFKKNVILKLHRRIGNNPFKVLIKGFETIDIDNEDDFLLADAVFNYLNLKK